MDILLFNKNVANKIWFAFTFTKISFAKFTLSYFFYRTTSIPSSTKLFNKIYYLCELIFFENALMFKSIAVIVNQIFIDYPCYECYSPSFFIAPPISTYVQSGKTAFLSITAVGEIIQPLPIFAPGLITALGNTTVPTPTFAVEETIADG